MKKLTFFLLFLAVCNFSFSYSHGTLIEDPLFPRYDESGELPRNFRIVHYANVGKSSSSFRGIKLLRASGSGQFSKQNFKKMLNQLSIDLDQLIVIDLRQESHGFINGKAVSWTDGVNNYGNLFKSRREIEKDEVQRLMLAKKSKTIIINPLKRPVKEKVKEITTEREVVEGYGIRYIRLPVIDHNRPDNDAVDQFIELVKNLPSDKWLHFHCKAGKGRTTIFLALYDIIKNCQTTSLEDILKRQHFIGGCDFFKIKATEVERKRAGISRIQFIHKFYTYCQQVPDFHISWTEWIEQQ